MALGKKNEGTRLRLEWQNETKRKVFHLYCKASVVIVVESLHLKEVDYDEIFRPRASLLFITDCAAKSANSYVSKHHLWKQTVSVYTCCCTNGIIWITAQLL